MTEDDGHAISYKVLKRGTPVKSADGIELGKVRRVQDDPRTNIFDGIVVDTEDGQRFVDAPEVARVAERWVTTTFAAADADRFMQQTGSRLGAVAKNTTTARRAKRLGDRMRDRWDRR